MKITIFSSLTKKEAESVIDAAEWIRYIRDGKFKPTVDQVRSYIKLGDKDKARDWKMKLPAAVWAGECRKGRFFKHTTSRTGYAIFDFDDLRDDQLLAARQLLEVFPWIVAVHVTASGRGLRVVANIGIVHIDVYRQAYEQVAERLHEITGLDLDMACKDFARASLASYDPDAYYNPQATVFPYGEEHNPLNYVPATGPDTSEDFRYLSNPVTQALNQGYRSEDAPDVDALINRFFYTHPYVQGSRTRTMLSLGLYLRRHGVQSWQLDNAIHTACARGVEPGITQKEIERAVRWGYEHGEEGGKSPTNWGQGGQISNMFPFHTVKTEENPDSEEIAENEKEEEEVIEEQCPQFA
uniref:BT4734/BF3469 family protein n=1 Tax=uncultured Bacteroides sp. TaxID=162156 RepID=UPI002623D217